MRTGLAKVLFLAAVVFAVALGQVTNDTSAGPSMGFSNVDMSALLDSLGMTEADLQKMQNDIQAQNGQNSTASTNTTNSSQSFAKPASQASSTSSSSQTTPSQSPLSTGAPSNATQSSSGFHDLSQL
jgi:hypothetical protein